MFRFLDKVVFTTLMLATSPLYAKVPSGFYDDAQGTKLDSAFFRLTEENGRWTKQYKILKTTSY